MLVMSSRSISDEATVHDSTDQFAWVQTTVKQEGPWAAYHKLSELRKLNDRDLKLRGIAEIVRAIIVRELLSQPKGLQAVPKLTADFLNNFDRYNLSAQEGYLVSLIDGRLDIQKLLMLSPFDQFTTIFNLARLENQNAITIPR